MPYDLCTTTVQPVWKSIKGWNCETTDLKDFDEIPKELSDYLTFLEAELNVPISIVSIGPNRNETLVKGTLADVFA